MSAAGWGWALAASVSTAYGLLRRTDQPALRRDVATRMDRERSAGGAVLAATWLAEGGTRSRLGAMVLRDADSVCSDPEPRGSRPLPTSWLGLALGLLCLSMLVPTLPLGDLFGAGVDASSATQGSADPSPVPGAEVPGLTEPSGGSPAPPPDLSEVARFEIRTNQKVYLLGEPIELTAVLRPLADAGGSVPLDVVVGLSDGLPSQDRGFGIGVRPVEAPWEWSLPGARDEPLEDRVDLVPHLRRFQIYKVGLITIEAWVAPRGHEEGVVVGGLASNRVTIQIAENRRKLQVRKPEPTQKKRSPQNRKRTRQKDGNAEARRGASRPKQGKPDRMAAAKRKAQAVKPLLASGPTTEKEVEVFERERGGTAPPPPPVPLPEAPTRTFIKREEHAVKRLGLSPRERRLVRSYWDAILKK